MNGKYKEVFVMNLEKIDSLKTPNITLYKLILKEDIETIINDSGAKDKELIYDSICSMPPEKYICMDRGILEQHLYQYLPTTSKGKASKKKIEKVRNTIDQIWDKSITVTGGDVFDSGIFKGDDTLNSKNYLITEHFLIDKLSKVPNLSNLEDKDPNYLLNITDRLLSIYKPYYEINRTEINVTDISESFELVKMGLKGEKNSI